MHKEIITFTTKGGDYNSWALDQMLNYVKNGFEQKTNWKYVQSIQFADVVIFGWFKGYKESEFLLKEKQIIICLLENDTKKVYFDLFNKEISRKIDIWLTQSSREKRRLKNNDYKAFVMPYIKSRYNNEAKNIKGIYDDKYLKILKDFKKKNNKKLIVSIQRDSSFINNKWLPKEQKNPKYLVEIYKECLKQNLSIMLVLCGVRRHWIIKELDINNLPYIFIGEKPNKKDDYLRKLPRDLISQITKECDFSIVNSSWEGGPLCIVESLEVNKLTFSTNVGFSKDLLSEQLILTGNLKNDIRTIKEITESPILTDKLLRDSIEKYNKFQSLDLEKILKEIIKIKKKKSEVFKNSLNLIYTKLIDNLISKIERFITRIFCFVKRLIFRLFGNIF